MTADLLLLLIVFGPCLGTLGIALTGRVAWLRDGVSILTTWLLLAGVMTLVVQFSGQANITLIEMLPGLSIAFRVEPLGLLFACIASGLWVINTLFGIGYMRANNESNQTVFFACFPLALTGAMGMAFAENLLTLFLFYELLTFSTYPLVTHKRTAAALKAGRTYMGILVAGSVCFLMVAIIWTYSVVGHVDFRLGGILTESLQGQTVSLLSPWLTTALLALFVFGTAKAALMPMHRWLPAAMVAPTPVSALLHAVAVVKGGVFTLVKVVVYIFGVDSLAGLGAGDWLPLAAGFTIITASIVALNADNLKRRLAYSTVSQLAYIVIAVAVLAPISPVAAGLHMLAHAVSKITLFFAAGNIYTAAHKTEISQLDGIGRQMPVTMLAFFIGAASLIGLPFTIGLVSKEYIIESAIMSDWWLVLGVLILSSLLNAAYFLPIVYRAFFCKPRRLYEHGEAPPFMLLAIIATSGLVVALSFIYQPVKALLMPLVVSDAAATHAINQSLLLWVTGWEVFAVVGMAVIWWLGRLAGGRWGMTYILVQLALANVALVATLGNSEWHWLTDQQVQEYLLILWSGMLVQSLLMAVVFIMLARRTSVLKPLPGTQVVATLVQWNATVRLQLTTAMHWFGSRLRVLHSPKGYLGHTVASSGLVLGVLLVLLIYLAMYLL